MYSKAAPKPGERKPDLFDLILELDKGITRKASGFDEIGPNLKLAKAQSWRVETRADGELLISRRYKDLEQKTARHTFPIEKLATLRVDKKNAEDIRNFCTRLNSATRFLRDQKQRLEIRLSWINDEVIKQFEAYYEARTIEPETCKDLINTLKSHLLPFWLSLPNLPPNEWHEHREEFAHYILKTFTSASRAKKARYFWSLFVGFLARRYRGQIAPWDWENQLSEKTLEKHYSITRNAETGEIDEDLAGVYIPNADFHAVLDFLERILAGSEDCKIKDLANVRGLSAALRLGRHLGPRRNEILGMFDRGKEVVYNDHLLINKQLGDWRKEEPLKRPKHGRIRRVSYFFATPRQVAAWTGDLCKWTGDQADHYLNSIMSLALERGYISRQYQWHDLRRSFLTDAYRYHDRILVSKSAGHSSSTVTDRYLKDIRNLSSVKFDGDATVTATSSSKIEHWFDGVLVVGLPPMAEIGLNLSVAEQARYDLIKGLDDSKLEALLTLLGVTKKSS